MIEDHRGRMRSRSIENLSATDRKIDITEQSGLEGISNISKDNPTNSLSNIFSNADLEDIDQADINRLIR